MTTMNNSIIFLGSDVHDEVSIILNGNNIGNFNSNNVFGVVLSNSLEPIDLVFNRKDVGWTVWLSQDDGDGWSYAVLPETEETAFTLEMMFDDTALVYTHEQDDEDETDE